MNFSNIKEWTITEGSVKQVTDSNGIVLWKKQGGHDYSQDYFFVEDVSGQANTLTIKKFDADAPTIALYKSTDQTNWSSVGNTSTSGNTITIPANSKVYLKASADHWANTFNAKFNYINCTGNYNIGGNIMSLLYGDNFVNTLLDNQFADQFRQLFYQSTTLIDAGDLILPTNTANECYLNMFENCTGLTTAPTLPATTLNIFCYYAMFHNCRALTTAPALPATTLVDSCYRIMFYGCTNLNTVTTYANDISANSCLNNWLNNVAATGDFYNLGSATYPSGNSGIPSGWTEHNTL